MLKDLNNKKGFTLIETMLGIAILTIAIIMATSLLTGLMRTNAENVRTMQAYYFAQEGLEAVRNIRDTNWLHNLDWKGEESLDIWGGKFEEGKEYAIDLNYAAFEVSRRERSESYGDKAQVRASRTWVMEEGGDGRIFTKDDQPTDFRRLISFDETEDGHLLVKSKVSWNVGAKEKEFVLSEILTNWKDGVL